MSLSINSSYSNKVILITGCTGFVGKVLLEKILRSLPQVARIYVLIRPKTGISVEERMNREVFQSPCFDMLRKIHGAGFRKFIEAKVRAVEGDIGEEKYIFENEVFEEIKSCLNFIINVAASIDFNLRLDQALQINFYGPQRLLSLAKQCPKFESFTNVSTCYVNSDKHGGYIEEKLYSYPDDPDQTAKDLMSIPPDEIVRRQKELIGAWPNSYTFTKSLSERSLQKNRGNIPLIIVRPSIIISSFLEPFPGWIDTIAAAGVFVILTGIGIIRTFLGEFHVRADVIPVDWVSNAIILASAYQLHQGNTFNMLQMGTSHTNAINWKTWQVYFTEYLQTQPFENTLRYPFAEVEPREWLFNLKNKTRNIWPAWMLLNYAKVSGNEDLKKKALKFQKLNDRMFQVNEIFRPFTTNDWCYETKKVFEVLDMMSEEERNIFKCNPQLIDQRLLSQLNIFGVQKYVLKQDSQPPQTGTSHLITRFNQNYFEDYSVALRKLQKIRPFDLKDLFDRVYYSGKVQSELSQSSLPPNQKKKLVENFLGDFRTKIDGKTVKPIFLMLHKLGRKNFEQIMINDSELKSLKEVSEKTRTAVLLLPSFKSIIDFAIISYIHVMYEVAMPIINVPRNPADIIGFASIIRRSGGFFIDQDHLKSKLYQMILEEMLGQMMKRGMTQEFHIEKNRQRSGKLNLPQDTVFTHYVNAFLKNYDQIEDLLLVPITISYDKVYEGYQYPFELLGEEPPKDSLVRIIKQVLNRQENNGKALINYCKPISLRGRIKNHSTPLNDLLVGANQDQGPEKSAKDNFVAQLQMEVLHALNDNQVVMTTSMIAALILEDRSGSFSEEILFKRTVWLYHEINARNAPQFCQQPPKAETVRTALQQLSAFLQHRKGHFEPHVKVQKDYKNILMLSYYRNSLIHIFVNEAFVALSLLAMGEKVCLEEGVNISRIQNHAFFLADLLSDEFVVKEQLKSEGVLREALKVMEKREFITVQEDTQIVKIAQNGLFGIKFLSSLIYPFIESYWVVFCFLKHCSVRISLSLLNLADKVQYLAETLYSEGQLIHYDCCSMEVLRNALGKLASLSILSQKNGLEMDESLREFVFAPDDEGKARQLKELYERTSFLKPVVSLSQGFVKIEDDVKRIVARPNKRAGPVIGKL